MPEREQKRKPAPARDTEEVVEAPAATDTGEKLKADIAAMSQENSKLSEENTGLKTENGNLSSQVTQLQAQVEALNKQISDMKAKKTSTAPRKK